MAAQTEPREAQADTKNQAGAKKNHLHRLGPRPLPQHLSLATGIWTNSAAALLALSNVLQNWLNTSQNTKLPPNLEQLQQSLADLAPQIALAEPAALMAAIQNEGRRRFDQLLTGIEAYRKYPHQRDLISRPVLWYQGTTRLRDYRTAHDHTKAARPRVLVIPSLVNRYYVLDLEADTSFLHWLDGNGFDPFVVDWDAPGPVERSFDLTDYVARRLEGALDAVKSEPGGPIHLIGYCMGGNLALALALRRQADIHGLVLLATPWDFHAESAEHAQMMGQIGRQLEPMLQVLGELPIDALQGFFSGRDPFQVLKKFQHFGTLDQSGVSARRFVALEDWLNDGVSLAAPVARECLIEWYGNNTPQKLAWKIGGKIVDPADLDRPTLNIIPSSDRIVPPGSALALARRCRQSVEMVPNAGHIGMIVGRSAARDVWEPLAAWLRKHS